MSLGMILVANLMIIGLIAYQRYSVGQTISQMTHVEKVKTAMNNASVKKFILRNSSNFDLITRVIKVSKILMILGVAGTSYMLFCSVIDVIHLPEFTFNQRLEILFSSMIWSTVTVGGAVLALTLTKEIKGKN